MMGNLLSDCELEFIACTVEDYYNTTGESVLFYSAWDTATKVDPYTNILYDEPEIEGVSGDEEFKFDGPYTLIGIVNEGDKDVEATERGKVSMRDGASCWFARSAVEAANAPAPKIGDVIVWQARAYDVLKIIKQGELGNTLTFTKYECELKLTTKFSPERRIAGDDVTAPV